MLEELLEKPDEQLLDALARRIWKCQLTSDMVNKGIDYNTQPECVRAAVRNKALQVWQNPYKPIDDLRHLRYQAQTIIDVSNKLKDISKGYDPK
jgi:Fe-S-cluster-containing dehydrogenase component